MPEIDPADPLDPNATIEDLGWVGDTMRLIMQLRDAGSPQTAIAEAFDLEEIELRRLVAMFVWSDWSQTNPQYNPQLVNPN
jgi:hypothetical protein